MDNRVQAFQQAAEQVFCGSAPGGAVLASSGKTVWSAGFGLADLEAKVPISADTRFLIGSVSKQFTAMAVLILAEKGKLGLDDPVTRYFPSFPAYGQAITLRHLLTHTSGIPEYLVDDFWNDPQHLDRDVSLAEVIAMIHTYQQPDFAAGTAFSYCNSAYVLLGDIIQQCSGQGYGDFLRETLLRPAGMSRTLVGEDPRQVAADQARGYRQGSDGAWEPAPYTMATIGWADGNLISTVKDLYLWHRFLQDHPPVSKKWFDVAFTPTTLLDGSPTGYGLGWFINERRGLQEVWHSGGTQGFTARFSRFPGADTTIVILTNYETSPRDYLTGVLARSLLGDDLAPLTGSVPAPQISQALAGTYRSESKEITLTLAADAAGLTAESTLWPDGIPVLAVDSGRFRLDSSHEYWFAIQENESGIQLMLDLNGRRILLNRVK